MSEEQKPAENVEAEAPGAEQARETEEAAGEVAVESLQLMLEDARNKADEHWNQLLRIQAELENTRRRAERDVESAHKFALERFAQELLPVKDSLELGLAAASGDTGDEAVAKLREGTELTLKMFDGVLDKFGIKGINPVGEAFNPELHQAMTMQESGEHAPNSVVLVMQKGYTLNDRLLRPALVVVAKAPAEQKGSNLDEQA